MGKIIGIVLIVVGIALIAWGYNVYDAVEAQLTRSLSGDTPVEAWLGMVGGAVCVAIGVFKLK